ncbi:hypothetical protein CEXT_774781 [Caerostris extrusa]|uniref:Uncharacterized protein n=1 Tax=Caerostris extrusa TaxID=172846 RepID=A0AAV4VNQ0_CAEEX|nr:hypothetical protein CEXT_774781 [Caerostris extrusa]
MSHKHQFLGGVVCSRQYQEMGTYAGYGRWALGSNSELPLALQLQLELVPVVPESTEELHVLEEPLVEQL